MYLLETGRQYQGRLALFSFDPNMDRVAKTLTSFLRALEMTQVNRYTQGAPFTGSPLSPIPPKNVMEALC